MNERLLRVRAAFELEFEISFPFPGAEILSIILCLLVTMDIVIKGTFYSMIVSPHSPEHIPLIWDELLWLLTHTDSQLLSSSLFNMTLLMIVIIPLLSAFRVAAPMESGLLRTILTYPVRRRDLLIFKGFEILMLVVLPITTGALIGIVLVDWLDIGLGSLLLFLSFWSMAIITERRQHAIQRCQIGFHTCHNNISIREFFAHATKNFDIFKLGKGNRVRQVSFKPNGPVLELAKG